MYLGTSDLALINVLLMFSFCNTPKNNKSRTRGPDLLRISQARRGRLGLQDRPQSTNDHRRFYLTDRSSRYTRQPTCRAILPHPTATMREIVHLQAGQCGNQIGAKFWEVRNDRPTRRDGRRTAGPKFLAKRHFARLDYCTVMVQDVRRIGMFLAFVRLGPKRSGSIRDETRVGGAAKSGAGGGGLFRRAEFNSST